MSNVASVEVLLAVTGVGFCPAARDLFAYDEQCRWLGSNSLIENKTGFVRSYRGWVGFLKVAGPRVRPVPLARVMC